VDFVRGVTGAFGLQLNGRVAWDVGHEVFRFIFIPTDKGGLHGKGGEELQPAERLTRQEGYKRSGRSYSEFIQFHHIERQMGCLRGVQPEVGRLATDGTWSGPTDDSRSRV